MEYNYNMEDFYNNIKFIVQNDVKSLYDQIIEVESHYFKRKTNDHRKWINF